MSCLPMVLQSWVRPHPRGHRASDAGRSATGASGITVLVVDDDERVRRLTSRMLRDLGYTAIEAGSGAEALAQLGRNDDVRVVVSDIVMPGMHGVELAERVRERYPRCRIVLVTGYAPDLLGEFGIRRPSVPVLVKPFRAEDLARRVRDVLGDLH